MGPSVDWLPEETLFERGPGDAVMGGHVAEDGRQCPDAKAALLPERLRGARHPLSSPSGDGSRSDVRFCIRSGGPGVRPALGRSDLEAASHGQQFIVHQVQSQNLRPVLVLEVAHHCIADHRP